MDPDTKKGLTFMRIERFTGTRAEARSSLWERAHKTLGLATFREHIDSTKCYYLRDITFRPRKHVEKYQQFEERRLMKFEA